MIADDENGDIDISSSSGVIECGAGDVIYVLVGYSGNFEGHETGFHTFSGFLLNKL